MKKLLSMILALTILIVPVGANTCMASDPSETISNSPDSEELFANVESTRKIDPEEPNAILNEQKKFEP